ncbi:MAG TPA: hypothetical protein VIK62_07810 [Verrucomicrobiae bacterium]
MKIKNLFGGVAILVCGSTALCVQPALAQVTLTGTNYIQNFNAISSGLPTGWSVRTNATTASLGTITSFPTAGKTWADTTGEFGNCASTMSNSGTNFNGLESTTPIQSNCTNRSLAIRQTAGFGDPGAAFVFQIANTTGCSNLTFSVDLNMLGVQAHSTAWTIAYAVGNAPASFTTLGSYADPGIFGATRETYSLGSDANNQSQNVWIRLVALSASTGTTGSRDTFGIDNFSLSWVNITPVNIARISIVAGNVQIDFAAGASDVPTAFLLASATRVDGDYADVGATITSPGAGLFRAVCAVNGAQQFYCIKRP